MTLVGLALSGLATACGPGGDGASSGGGGQESAKDTATIYTDFIAAEQVAKSAHIKATMASDLTYDITVLASGDLSGSIDVQGVHADVVVSGGKLYVKGAAWWNRVEPAGAAAVGDNFGIASSSDLKGLEDSLGEFASPQKIAAFLKGHENGVAKGDVSTVDGVEVVSIKAADSVLYIANTSRPYLIRFESIPATQPPTLDISDYDKGPAAITPPAGAVDPNGAGSASSSDSSSDSSST
jgi:hypothetical protein